MKKLLFTCLLAFLLIPALVPAEQAPVNETLGTDLDAFTLDHQVDKDAVLVGEPLTITLMPEGGVPPYTYKIYGHTGGSASGVVVKDVKKLEENVYAIRLPFASLGGWDIYLYATDSEGRTINKYFTVEVTEEASSLEIAFTLSKHVLAPDETVQISWEISGGTPPYEITSALWYILENANAPESYEVLIKDNRASFTARAEDYENGIGEFVSGKLYLAVKDAAGEIAGFSSPEFIAKRRQRETTVSLSADSVRQGQPITVTCQTMLGEEMQSDVQYRYTWIIEMADGSTKEYPDDDYTTGKTESDFVPTEGVRGQVQVVVKYLDGAYGFPTQELTTDVFTIIHPGDADGNNKIEPADLEAVIDYLVLGTAPANPENADADGKDGIDLKDLIYLVDNLSK